ncbi:MAG: metal-dependent transcriptional regulator [Clostridia bacterium]|nr:metal-dependent transcriptional regulator [Clostridia bacterium]
MDLQESGQMYLETILILSRKTNNVRSLDVAEYMNFSKPSVSRAVGLLKNGGFITSDKDGFLYLTEIGKEVAEQIFERHNILTDYLVSIGVNREIASQDACKMEHHISQETFEAIKKQINKN